MKKLMFIATVAICAAVAVAEDAAAPAAQAPAPAQGKPAAAAPAKPGEKVKRRRATAEEIKARRAARIAAEGGLVTAPTQGRVVRILNRTDKVTVAELEEMTAAADDPTIRHIVLVSHWAIAPKGPDFVCPIVDACKENKFNDNRKRLLALAEKCGCDLYINGHEHNGRYPVGKVGSLSDINCGTVTGAQASWSIVEIHPDKAVFNVYSRAAAVETPDGKVTYTQLPQRLFTREIPLMPIRHSMAV